MLNAQVVDPAQRQVPRTSFRWPKLCDSIVTDELPSHAHASCQISVNHKQIDIKEAHLYKYGQKTILR